MHSHKEDMDYHYTSDVYEDLRDHETNASGDYLDDPTLWNETLWTDEFYQKFLECKASFGDVNETDIDSYCPTNYDSIMCWPFTLAGQFATQPCFKEFNNIPYDDSGNVSRFCNEQGKWEKPSYYEHCKPLEVIIANTTDHTIWGYYIGYGISLVALFIAVLIFMCLKELRCLRNTIHVNLFLSYIFTDLLWLATAAGTFSYSGLGSCFCYISIHYFLLTNFFWMFVEGFYLYMLVVWTFTVENIPTFVYLLLGWGVPILVFIPWIIVKKLLHVAPQLNHNSTLMSLTANVTNLDVIADVHPKEGLDVYPDSCLWVNRNSYDWIYNVPILVILGINATFLVVIMSVLITKLRAARSIESQQYYKAAKALLVLIPLLGLTYVILLMGPTDGYEEIIFSLIRAILISIQGFSVAWFYCFLNSEVRSALIHRYHRWKEHRSIGRHTSGIKSGKEGRKSTSTSYRFYNRKGSCVTENVTLNYTKDVDGYNTSEIL